MDVSATIRIDLASPIPAYRQIADAVRAQLVAGRFSAGDQLATVRELALDLGVHHNTVAEAYRILADEGWLALGRRRGATVLERPTPRPTATASARFRRRLRELVAEALGAGVPADAARSELEDLAREMGAKEGVR